MSTLRQLLKFSPLVIIGILPFSVAAAPIPAQYPVYSLNTKDGVKIGKAGGVVVNGVAQPKPGSLINYIDIGGVQGAVSPLPELPCIPTVVYPSNPQTNGNVDVTGSMTLSNDVIEYYKDIKVKKGAGNNLTVTGAGEEFHVNQLIIEDDATATLGSGTYYFHDRLELKKRATLHLNAGTYYIDELKMDEDARIIIDSGPVIFHITKKLQMDKKRSQVNAGGAPSDLQMYFHPGAEIDQSSGDQLVMSALVYGPQAGQFVLAKNSDFSGAFINGLGKIEIKGDPKNGQTSRFTYSGADQAALSAIQTCVTLDHYTITHDGSGVTCMAETITITPHDTAHLPLDLDNANTITLSTTINGAAATGGDWYLVDPVANTGVLTNLGAGSATYQFNGDGSLGVALAFSYPQLTAAPAPDTLNFNVSDGTFTELSGLALDGTDPLPDADLIFTEAGFQFIDGAGGNVIASQVAGKPSHLPSASQNLFLQAIRTDTTTGSCLPLFADGQVATVELGSSCLDPASCSAGQQVTLYHNATATDSGLPATTPLANPQNPVGGLAYNPVPLRFGANGMAPIAVMAPDAGLQQLHARYPLSHPDATPTGLYMMGSSNGFVVRPFGFDIDFADDRALNGITGASYAADATGSPFIAAGTPLATTLTAVAWQTADDLDGNGIPDAGAALGDNPVTPNYGNESLATPVAVNHTLVAPAGGSAGTLTLNPVAISNNSFTAGVANLSLQWSEVGIIDITAQQNGYLGAVAPFGSVAGLVSNVGRFFPASFATAVNNPGSYADMCTLGSQPFNYLGQPFGYDPLNLPRFTLTALNGEAVPLVTTNYTALFNKLTVDEVTLQYPTVDSTAFDETAAPLGISATTAPAGANHTLADNGNGTLTLTLGAVASDSFSYQRASAKVGPFTADLPIAVAAISETTDGVTASGVPLALTPLGNHQRFGRAVVIDTYGRESDALPLPFWTHYFDGGAFIVNGDDLCSSYPATALNCSDPDATDALACAATSVNGTPLSGSNFQLSAPNTAGTLRYSLAVDSWLQYDWGSGSYTDTPAANATWGLFRGDDRFIFWREVE
ncbi:MAG: hypothetical protein OEZ16_01600 [Chromatiales bacterium]|nr:hypothetical protein [Chromatiales bacterium]